MYLNTKVHANGSITITDIDDDGKKETHEISPDRILSYLISNVEIDKEFTLYSYFTMLSKYPKLQELDMWIPDYMKTFNQKKLRALEPSKTDIKYIIIAPIVELDESEMKEGVASKMFEELTDDSDDMPSGLVSRVINTDRDASDYNEIKSANYYYNVYGRISEDKDSDSYSISLTSIDEILQCKILLDDDILVNTNDTMNSKYTNIEYRNDRGINLFELVTSVIYELSFHGNDDNKVEQLAELKGVIEELDKQLEKENIKREGDDNE